MWFFTTIEYWCWDEKKQLEVTINKTSCFCFLLLYDILVSEGIFPKKEKKNIQVLVISAALLLNCLQVCYARVGQLKMSDICFFCWLFLNFIHKSFGTGTKTKEGIMTTVHYHLTYNQLA